MANLRFTWRPSAIAQTWVMRFQTTRIPTTVVFRPLIFIQNLDQGQHEIQVRVFDDAGNYNEASVAFTTEKFKSSFIASEDSVDLSTAHRTAWYDKQSLLVEGATIENEEWDFLLKWDQASQSFKTEGIFRSAEQYYSYGGGVSESSFGFNSGFAGGTSSDSDSTTDGSDASDSDDTSGSGGGFAIGGSNTAGGTGSAPSDEGSASDGSKYSDFCAAGRTPAFGSNPELFDQVCNEDGTVKEDSDNDSGGSSGSGFDHGSGDSGANSSSGGTESGDGYGSDGGGTGTVLLRARQIPAMRPVITPLAPQRIRIIPPVTTTVLT